MIICNDFIGFENAGKVVSFSGGDGQELFLENLKTQPDDWLYRKLSISYAYNNNGHRSKAIEDIDLDNYILFTGCSHTEGIGLRLEDTFPYKVAKALNCDYYNLAMGGTGIDVLEHNLVTWLSKIKKKPKHLIVQWPDHSRFAALSPGYKNLLQSGTWNRDPNALRFIASAEQSGFFQARKMISYNMIQNMVDMPILDVQFASLESWSNACVWLKKIDVARDFCHSGIKSHQDITENILKHISIR